MSPIEREKRMVEILNIICGKSLTQREYTPLWLELVRLHEQRPAAVVEQMEAERGLS